MQDLKLWLEDYSQSDYYNLITFSLRRSPIGVGQTIQPIEVRDYAHYYEAFNQNKGGKFNNALRKYGKGGFIRSIVHEITADTANGLQRQLDHKIDGQLKYAYSDLFQV